MEKILKLMLLLVLLAALFVISFLITGKWSIPQGDVGLYFQIGLSLVILGSLFVEQYFTKPSDVIVNALVVVISLLTISDRSKFLYWTPLLYSCIALFVFAMVSIALFDPNKPEASIQNRISKDMILNMR